MTGSSRTDFARDCAQFLEHCQHAAAAVNTLQVRGRLTRVAGLVMEAVGLKLGVGSSCLIEQADIGTLEAEVVGFAGDRLFLMPVYDVHGLSPARVVVPLGRSARARNPDAPAPAAAHDRSGDAPAGRRSSAGPRARWRRSSTRRAGCGPRKCGRCRAVRSIPSRATDHHALDVGVRAINSLLTVGRGQRMGLFAGSGVGKSVLLGMMARYTRADVIVVGLIGERGREVKEFIEQILGAEGWRGRSWSLRRPTRAADAHAGRRLRHHHRRILP